MILKKIQLPWIEYICLVISIVAIIIIRIYFIFNHFSNFGDFYLYYDASVLLLQGRLDLVYNHEYWYSVTNFLPYPYPPFTFALIWFLGFFTLEQAGIIWAIISLIITIFNNLIFRKILYKLYPNEYIRVGIALLILNINVIVWYDAMYFQKNQLTLFFIFISILRAKDTDSKTDWISIICLSMAVCLHVYLLFMYAAYILLSSIDKSKIPDPNLSIFLRLKYIQIKKIVPFLIVMGIGNIAVLFVLPTFINMYVNLRSFGYTIDFLSYSFFGLIAYFLNLGPIVITLGSLIGLLITTILLIIWKPNLTFIELLMWNSMIFLVWNTLLEHHHLIIFMPFYILITWRYVPTFKMNWKTLYVIIAPLLIALPIPHSIFIAVGLSGITFFKRFFGYIFFINPSIFERLKSMIIPKKNKEKLEKIAI